MRRTGEHVLHDGRPVLDGAAAAFDTRVTVTAAQQGKPLAVSGPGGGTVRFTADWFLDEGGNVFLGTDSWNAGEYRSRPLRSVPAP